MSIRIGLVRESATGERRVALDPPTAARLIQAGCTVQVAAGAGVEAGHPDDAWGECRILDSSEAVARESDVLVCVQRPAASVLDALPASALLAGLLAPFRALDGLQSTVKRGVAMISMELVPRITRAQAMDVLSSQATIAGYKGVILAADLAPRLFPMLTTAAGTLRPARAVIIGAGVAGLQAIATARRLGAQVEAYDIRAAAREQVESLGARMIDTGVDAETEGGYARELTDDERARQAAALADHLTRADVVISTAAIPGRAAPRIITADMVAGMKPGAVIVDIAAETGGNCELTRPGENVNVNGVLIAGALNLPSRAPAHASEMYARNIFNLLSLMLDEGSLKIDPEDDVIRGCLLAHQGRIVHERFV